MESLFIVYAYIFPSQFQPCMTAKTHAFCGMVLTGLLIFRAVAEPRISSKSAKSREIHKNTRNPAQFARNLAKYLSAQHI